MNIMLISITDSGERGGSLELQMVVSRRAYVCVTLCNRYSIQGVCASVRA